MAVKILLADKSITIQKVVEMLFSGKEYAVLCVSDGETGLAEAGRSVPDVVLVDVDLPRVDGYAFAARLKASSALAQTPVILMLSRDDVFDAGKARQAGIVDHIQKPFESQELIGKVKKAIAAAPPRLAEPGPAQPRPAAVAPAPRPSAAPTAPSKPKQAVPSDIFDIIQEAPSEDEFKQAAAAPPDESVFEVEPEVEIEEPLGRALPVGKKAVEEIRAGLGLADEPVQAPDIVSFESLDAAARMPQEYAPPAWEPGVKAPVREPEMPARQIPQPTVSEEELRSIAEETVSRIAREVLEKVAWEIIPDLAERLIREEIERLKTGV